MPKVNTDEPAIPKADAKSVPAFHQMINANPNTMRSSQSANSATIEAGPTKDSTRSRSS